MAFLPLKFTEHSISANALAVLKAPRSVKCIPAPRGWKTISAQTIAIFKNTSRQEKYFQIKSPALSSSISGKCTQLKPAVQSKSSIMPASFRSQFFRAVHRPLRLPQLRLGQDWEMEVRPLSLTPEPSKPIDTKFNTKSPTSTSKYGAPNPVVSGNLSTSVP